MRARKAKIHQRVDGNLVPLDLELPQPAEVELGGAGLYGTVGDYLKFVRMILNKGAGENGRVLREETVALLSTNQRSEEHTSELQSLMRISYAVFCLKKKKLYKISEHTELERSSTKHSHITHAKRINNEKSISI